ncbi:hypothetical protein TELCIR_07942 [Teladorsagia circumcincta]|uniref:Large subunit GTPase 1 homolog n=1 Tax=Teladorsagia circumcincta TaxID=45464 RepID=A0A2G9UIZ5_TELCI|nr:hypothetical protein TELCIR_07942 [Teladorsagia circumcincta]
MTKRRPSNKKPTGANKSLGNSLLNERVRVRQAHQRSKYDGEEIENPAFMDIEANKYIDSVTEETSLEEFLAKAELAGTEFTAERQQFRVIEKLNDGLALTPFERNPDMWRELWRVVERSDIVIQRLTCTALFRTAVEEPEEAEEECCSAPSTAPSSSNGVLFLRSRDQLIQYLKDMGHVIDSPGCKPVVVGMVGYPNVGKSSTINRIADGKKVSVSATPGKTRHFQTVHIDSQLVLCDCPGLVMPSFAFGRNEMFLNAPPKSDLSDVSVKFLYSVSLRSYHSHWRNFETNHPIN